MSKKIVLNRSITDPDSLSVLVAGTVYSVDQAPKLVKDLFEAGDNRVSEYVKLADDQEDTAVSEESSAESEEVSTENENTDEPDSQDAKVDSLGLDGIKGVGPKVKEKLNAAGITTKEQLADLGKDELIKIVGPMVAKNIVV